MSLKQPLIDSNYRIQQSKCCALPLGERAIIYVPKLLAAVLAFDRTLMLINKPVLCTSDLGNGYFLQGNYCTLITSVHVYKLPL